PPRLSNEALGVLLHHPFYGNIRELRNTMERACVLARGGYIGPEHLLFETPPGAPPASAAPAVALPPNRFFAPTAPTEPPGPPVDMAPIVVPPPPRAPSAPPPMRPPTMPPPAPPSGPLKEQMTAFERDRIVSALEECNGNQTRAAEMLGMS